MSHEIIKGKLAVRGRWIVASVETHVHWPVETTEVAFRERQLYLTPETKDLYPAVCMNMPSGMQFEEGQRIIFHFLSSLSWVEGSGIGVASWGGGNLPRPMGKGPTVRMISKRFRLDYLPDPEDQKTRWALAFFREGLTLDHVAYKFLSFYKVINIVRKTGKEQKAWINQNIGGLGDFQAKRRIDALTQDGTNIGEYLYGSNRCAIAHAGGNPTVDPEDPNDMKRLSEDISLIRAISRHAIEKEFGVKTSQTIWREHLYELEGFRTLFGSDITARLKSAQEVALEDLPPIPSLSVRLAESEKFDALEDLQSEAVEVSEGQVILRCMSADQLNGIVICLNFPDERMQIDAEQGLVAHDDGTEVAARKAAQIMQFRLEYLLNGLLQVWNADTEGLIGRCDAYIPTNVDLGATAKNFREIIQRIEGEADRRSIE